MAYGSLLQGRQRMLHVRIVEAVDGLYANRLAEQVGRLAHHALRGSDSVGSRSQSRAS